VRQIKPLSKRYMGLAYVIAVAAIFAAWVLKSGRGPAVIAQLRALDARFVCLSAALITGYVLVRALTLYAYLRHEGRPIAFAKALLVTGIGQFYSAITPSSSGGQPFEVLSMRRWGIPAPVATAAVSVQFIFFQAALVALSALLWIFQRAAVAEHLGPLRWLAAAGLLINSALPLMLALLSGNRRLMGGMARGVIGLAARIKLVRHPEAAVQKIDRMIEAYRAALLTVFTKPAAAVQMALLSLMQVALLMLIILGVYGAFPLEGASPAALVALNALLYVSASFMPMPGASGAQEYGFSIFFSALIPEPMMISALFFWRFFTYYALLFAGLLAVVMEGMLHFFARGREDADGTP
jgi:uncharacterized protein (TIRG00374 family)